MKGKKILVIDDDVSFCDMLKEILEAEGADVLLEHDGVSGINTALEKHPDLLVIDVMMPQMSGIAVLEKLRGDEWGKSIPAILLTNVNEPDAMAASMEHGPATEYLLKIDWTLDQIAEKINKIFAE